MRPFRQRVVWRRPGRCVSRTNALVCDNGGRLLADHARSKVSTTVAARLVPANAAAFRLYEDDGVVDITQADIRQVQLAAIRAAIEVLSRVKYNASRYYRVILAGALTLFSQKCYAWAYCHLYHRTHSSIGNASGASAVLALTSPRAIAECTLIASIAEHIELETNPCFKIVHLRHEHFCLASFTSCVNYRP